MEAHAIKVKVAKVIWHKEDSNFYILSANELDGTFSEENNVPPICVKTLGKTKQVVITGDFPNAVSQNTCLKLLVKPTEYTDKKTGETRHQLTLVKQLEYSYDEYNKESIVEYLKAILKGVSKRDILAIVGKFGNETMKYLADIDSLSTIPGITREKAESIAMQHINSEEFLLIMKSLENVGIDSPTPMTTELLLKYGDKNDKSKVFNLLCETPYKPFEDGIYDFQTALAIATMRENIEDIILGFEFPEFTRAVIMDIFGQIENSGHCCISDFNLFEVAKTQIANYYKQVYNIAEKEAKSIVEQNKQNICTAIIDLVQEGILTRSEYKYEDDDDEMYFLYRSEVFDAEQFASAQILKMVHPDAEDVPDNVDELLDEMQAELGMKYADCQLDAIKAPLNSHVVIITGGPGTGKTTTVNGLIKFQQKLNPNIKILCAAPTGRASQRMAEATGMPASTIHRLLEVVPQDGLLTFKHNAQNPLDCDLLVVDEFSMVDIVLFGSLLRGIKPTTKVAFVGDSNQLPSVGPGSVLKDMIESKIVPSIELQIVFRQDSTSLIAVNANAIKMGQVKTVSDLQQGNDFYVTLKNSDDEIKNQTTSLFKATLDDYIKRGMQDAIYQVQILCPVKKNTYELGASALNPILRDIANPKADKKREYRNSQGKCIFREGDKVMQRKNNYKKDCYNGDLGLIQKIDLDAKELIVLFQFKKELVTYSFQEVGEIELAYATTIHKSQGSEYACTIIPISPKYNGQGFNSKNLLYTGITRAKKVFHFIGDGNAIAYGLQNTQTTNRCTTLRQRIAGEKKVKDIAGMQLLGEIEAIVLE